MQIAFVAVAPFLAGLIAPLAVRLAGRFSGGLLAAVPAAIVLFLLSLVPVVVEHGFIAASIAWVPSQNIALSFRLDGLSLMFGLTIAGIGTFIVLFSGAYLRGHQHLGRFQGYLLAFMGAMLGLVLADNLLVLFGFWELTAVTSFLLIGFDHARQAARRAAIQALVVTNIGGLALLFGAVVLHQLSGSWQISGLTHLGDRPAYWLVLVPVVLAAFTKSAQVPFHFWLPNAMAAPTPVSAFLHSATMVQAGVYLLARLTPVLGGTVAWMAILTLFGGVTLLWGGLGALRQTDLKQLLAHSTIASLGLLVLLLGIGSPAAIAAMVVYFVAHALYKAGLFMLVGTIDQGTGSREIAALGGLRRKMPLSFAAAILAALSMVGLPLTLGYLAKEELYLALTRTDWAGIVLLAVAIAGNGVLAALALAIAIRPFTGVLQPTPIEAHEGSFGLVAGPLVLGIAGVGLAVATDWFGRAVLTPAASAILGTPVQSHLILVPDFGTPVPLLSLLTWVLGGLVFLQMTGLRAWLRRNMAWAGLADCLFDTLMFGLIRLAGTVTRSLHHGRLDLYLLLLFIGFFAAAASPMLVLGYSLPSAPMVWWQGLLAARISLHEALVLGLVVVGLVVLLVSRNRLLAILSLGVQGVGTALLFLLFGAPDLGFTQFMVEILSVVILALVMTRLDLDGRDRRPWEIIGRDGVVALLCGLAISRLLGLVVSGPFNNRLSEFFAANSVPIAHGRNIVNVILVDYRGLDTLGEISVVLGAGLAVAALLRQRPGVRP